MDTTTTTTTTTTTEDQTGAAGMLRYEIIEPTFTLMKDKDSETVLVLYVPDFKKENLKIQLDNNHCRIRVSGSRPVEDNKWIRFSKDFQVSRDCDTGRIRASFDNSNLYVTMPLVQPVDTSRPATKEEEEEEEEKNNNNDDNKTTTTTTDSKPAARVIGGRLKEKVQNRYSKSKVLNVVVMILLLLGLASSYIRKIMKQQPPQLQQVLETEKGISQWIAHP